jgi:uncharacterized membrane protein YdjX (TVP38/TMEM64 family)
MQSLWVLSALLFVDGATLAAFSTVLVLTYGRLHEPWALALAGGTASALGAALQLWILRWALNSKQPWMHRFAPSREKVEAALSRYPSASFMLIAIARATTLPDAPLKLVAATIAYPIRLYFLASWIGIVPYFFVLAFLGHKFRIPVWVLLALAAVVIAGIALDFVRRRKNTA